MLSYTEKESKEHFERHCALTSAQLSIQPSTHLGALDWNRRSLENFLNKLQIKEDQEIHENGENITMVKTFCWLLLLQGFYSYVVTMKTKMKEIPHYLLLSTVC